MKRSCYPIDLTDEQWLRVELHIPASKPGGFRWEVDKRRVFNALLYQSRTGCQWRALPEDLSPWGTVGDYFYRFRDDGPWGLLHDLLSEHVRVAAGKEPTPSEAVIDSQSVKRTEKGGLPRLRRGEKGERSEATHCGGHAGDDPGGGGRHRGHSGAVNICSGCQ